jgi:quercetin dioxygenase-like cupin family protein
MAIHVRHGDNVAWEENQPGVSDGAVRWGIRTKPYFDPTEVGVLLRLVEYAPGYVAEAHSHAAPEIVYILDGDITIGEQRLGAGDAYHIEPNTVYGPLRAGEKGARFVLLFTGAPGMTPA